MTVPILSDKAIPFTYKTYTEDWAIAYDQTRKLLLPRPDTYRYVFWEKNYVCSWFVKNNKKDLPDTIRIARYRAYPVGPGRVKSSKEESMTWVKNNLPYICLLHCYGFFNPAANVYLKFTEEFQEAEELMRARGKDVTEIKRQIALDDLADDEAYYGGFCF